MKRLLLTICLASVALTATACSAPGVSSVGGSQGAPAAPAQPGTPSQGSQDAQKDGTIAEQQVVTTGSLILRVDRPADEAQRAVQIVEASGGRIAARTEQAGTDRQPPSARLTLRIPSARLTTVLDELKGVGTVVSLTLNQSDVTQKAQDLDARITALRTSVNRLLNLLAGATNTADLLAIETTLSQRQAELDSLVSQRDYLADQVDYSTIDLQLVSANVIPSAGPGDFWGGLIVGWNSVVAFGSAALVALGVALPWILVLAALAGIVVLVVLFSTRGHRTHPREHQDTLR